MTSQGHGCLASGMDSNQDVRLPWAGLGDKQHSPTSNCGLEPSSWGAPPPISLEAGRERGWGCFCALEEPDPAPLVSPGRPPPSIGTHIGQRLGSEGWAQKGGGGAS